MRPFVVLIGGNLMTWLGAIVSWQTLHVALSLAATSSSVVLSVVTLRWIFQQDKARQVADTARIEADDERVEADHRREDADEKRDQP